MVIRIASQETESAKSLVAALVRLFGGEDVSLQPTGEVHVQLNGRAGERAVTETLASVERWLHDTGIAATDIWVDERRYRMERPRPLLESTKLGQEAVDLFGRVVMDEPDPDPAVG